MKIFALYLPQYHTFKENDEWWGKGFTEWTNTKKSMPLYKDHYQPKEPLNDYYYDLSEDEPKILQAKIAKEYGIDAFVYYHYWFNGKLLMQKPLEQMLRNEKVNINFCLSWANEPWTRSWDGKSKEIIMPQNYGDRNDWKVHFDYLNKFFKDKRYIKIDNKPVLFIYRVNSIDDYDEMFEFWNDEAIKNGYNGVYIVETLSKFQMKECSKISNAVFLFEPMYTTSHEYTKASRALNCIKKLFPSMIRGKRYLFTNNYDMISKKIVKRKFETEKDLILGYFPSWDNTARRGKSASIIEGSNPKKFGNYLRRIITENEKKSDIIVINAWNEWAEGAYLEPDKKNKYNYLEEVKKIKENI